MSKIHQFLVRSGQSGLNYFRHFRQSHLEFACLVCRLYKKHTLKLVSKENSNFATDVAELISAENYDPVDAILMKPVADDYSSSVWCLLG